MESALPFCEKIFWNQHLLRLHSPSAQNMSEKDIIERNTLVCIPYPLY